MSREMQIQALLMFQKTLFDYMEFLESIYLSEEVVVINETIKKQHQRMNDRMVMIDRSSQRYGGKGFLVPKFVNVTGHC